MYESKNRPHAGSSPRWTGAGDEPPATTADGAGDERETQKPEREAAHAGVKNECEHDAVPDACREPSEKATKGELEDPQIYGANEDPGHCTEGQSPSDFFDGQVL